MSGCGFTDWHFTEDRVWIYVWSGLLPEEYPRLFHGHCVDSRTFWLKYCRYCVTSEDRVLLYACNKKILIQLWKQAQFQSKITEDVSENGGTSLALELYCADSLGRRWQSKISVDTVSSQQCIVVGKGTKNKHTSAEIISEWIERHLQKFIYNNFDHQNQKCHTSLNGISLAFNLLFYMVTLGSGKLWWAFSLFHGFLINTVYMHQMSTCMWKVHVAHSDKPTENCHLAQFPSALQRSLASFRPLGMIYFYFFAFIS